MKKIVKLIKSVPVLLLGAMLFTSCVKEVRTEFGSIDGQGDVKFNLQTPEPMKVLTRASNVDENYVKTLHMAVFNQADGKLVTVVDKVTSELTPTSSDASNPKDTWSFKKGFDLTKRYDFVVVANADIPAVTNNVTTKTDFITAINAQSFIDANLTETNRWDLSSTKPIPMWGEYECTANLVANQVIDIPLKRLMARVNLNVSAVAQANFTLSEVRFYNYNTKGQLVPNHDGSNYEYPSIPSTSGKHTTTAPACFIYDNTDGVTATACENLIYVFENANIGKYSDGAAKKWQDNPCVVVGGSYDGGAVTYYRLDFIKMVDTDSNGTPDTEEWLDVKRNHSYVFNITKVNGNGYTDPEEALKSAPLNMDATVTPWDDESLDILYNGPYSIEFSARKVHFDQFAQPTPQTIKIVTNCPSLTFGGFFTNTGLQNDGTWDETSSGVWTNGHFEVNISAPVVIGDHREYTLTVKADPTIAGDDSRQSTFTVFGNGMQAGVTISQDEHILYRLITSPDPTNIIKLSGTKQRVEIQVTSTHPYLVDFKGDPMFLGVYTVATGGVALTAGEQVYIDNTTNSTIWVEVDTYNSITPRIGEFTIGHVEPLSDANPVIYLVAQVTPVISAVLSGGGFSATVQKDGGTATINVTSNMVEWKPILTIDGGGPVLDADLTKYLGITSGNLNQTVTFTADAWTGLADRVFSLIFKDANGATVTSPPIVITQKAADPGGTADRITWNAATQKYEITNDPTDAGLYFKYGSVIAIYSDHHANKVLPATTSSSDTFDTGDVPLDFSTVAIRTYASIPYASGLITIDAAYHTVANVKAGKGDPCRLVGLDLNKIKNTAAGSLTTGDIDNGIWMLPTMEENKQFSGQTSNVNYSRHWWANGNTAFSGVAGGEFKDRTASGDPSKFLPAAGNRGTLGSVTTQGTHGYYWSSTPPGLASGYFLYFNNGSVYPMYIYSKTSGFSVRCVSQ